MLTVCMFVCVNLFVIMLVYFSFDTYISLVIILHFIIYYCYHISLLYHGGCFTTEYSFHVSDTNYPIRLFALCTLFIIIINYLLYSYFIQI